MAKPLFRGSAILADDGSRVVRAFVVKRGLLEMGRL